MTESILGSDEGAEGAKSSHDADVDAGYDSDERTDGLIPGVDANADGEGSDSHAADIDAGYDDESDSPVGDDRSTDR